MHFWILLKRTYPGLDKQDSRISRLQETPLHIWVQGQEVFAQRTFCIVYTLCRYKTRMTSEQVGFVKHEFHKVKMAILRQTSQRGQFMSKQRYQGLLPWCHLNGFH